MLGMCDLNHHWKEGFWRTEKETVESLSPGGVKARLFEPL
jgi:hypothetical protein